MPTVEHNGASIYYEVHGKGFPILTFAPAGLESSIAVWGQPMSAIHPVTEWSNEFRVIVMDQRNASTGRSRAPITAQDSYDTYTADHIAVLDHLGIRKCHLYGQCIGGPFIMGMLKLHPERVACAVAAQPSGRMGPMQGKRTPSFQAWTEKLKDHPEATEAVLDAMAQNLYAAGYLYTVQRDFLATIKTPMMVLAGNDAAHPHELSVEMSQLIPGVEFIDEWKSGAALEAARPRVRAFLKKHTPASA